MKVIPRALDTLIGSKKEVRRIKLGLVRGVLEISTIMESFHEMSNQQCGDS